MGSIGSKTRGTSDGKVGSDASAAKHFADKNDFGIPSQDAGRFTGAAEEAKYQPEGDHQHDPRQAHSGGDGNRDSGVGGVNAGPGSSSGGDVDTDIVGVGIQGSGLSEGGPDERTQGADMTTAGSGKLDAHPHEPRVQMRGNTINRSGGDFTTSGESEGAASMSVADAGDDAAAGELSNGEAAGDDNTDLDNET
jgi:hypothetical protein